MQQQVFEKYFTLEEAVGLIPFVINTFDKAHVELAELSDDIFLYKRMHQIQEEEGLLADKSEKKTTTPIMEVLHHKWHAYEGCFYRWVNVLVDKGIQVRDFKKGLIDFPYQAKDGSEYFLCWHLGEEGLFYFHDLVEGFSGRKPISLLPE
jgi:hypothetical protein